MKITRSQLESAQDIVQQESLGIDDMYTEDAKLYIKEIATNTPGTSVGNKALIFDIGIRIGLEIANQTKLLN